MTVIERRAERNRSLRVALVLLLGGCSHDWSAADADATTEPEADGIGDGVVVEDASPPDDSNAREDALPTDGDGGVTDGRPPDDDTGPQDAPPEAADCREGERHCWDETLATCDPEAGGWVFRECPLGCLEDATNPAHCAELVPSNVPPGETWDRGTMPLECSGGDVLALDTEEGGIYRRLEDPSVEEVLREPGEGTIRGIPFRRYWSPAGDTSLAAWSLGSLRVGEGCVVAFYGAWPAALFVDGDVVVEGRLTAAAAVLETEPGAPGPGGGRGGWGGTNGGGPGWGGAGRSGTEYDDGGGGGGGFGGRGGAGGTIRSADGGVRGGAYGTAQLVPLLGGSGGGGGSGAASCGGTGGGGGGALQITAQGAIRIGTRGSIDAGGGGGQGGLICGASVGAGGGGGSGGAILLEAASVDLYGVVAANGGGGGAGGSFELGVVGMAGTAGQPRLTAAPGGSAATGGTDGGNGSDATNPDGRDGENAISRTERNGGGGGGGAGRIRINVALPVAIVEGHLSPDPGTGLATFGSPAVR